MRFKRRGSVVLNHGLWYYSVRLPGEKRRRYVPLRAPGSDHTLAADRPRKMAEDAANRYWEAHTRSGEGYTQNSADVEGLCDLWAKHCRECFVDPDGKPTSTAVNAVIDVRLFREMFAHAAICELTHADMLQLRDALVRSGIARKTVNSRLWRVKAMLAWALDEALIPASVKTELTQVKGLRRGRTTAHETPPIRAVSDADVDAALRFMVANSADMVRVNRYTGMRPGELCAMTWADIDTSVTPWVYRPKEHKNSWRGELGQPRAVCIGPKARAILERHRGGVAPFSPQRALTELIESGKHSPGAYSPRIAGPSWHTDSYNRSIHRACEKAQIRAWSAMQLRHTFATEVRRAFGLDAARAVLGHTGGGCITDVYSFDAIEEESIRRAAPAVEALG